MKEKVADPSIFLRTNTLSLPYCRQGERVRKETE